MTQEPETKPITRPLTKPQPPEPIHGMPQVEQIKLRTLDRLTTGVVDLKVIFADGLVVGFDTEEGNVFPDAVLHGEQIDIRDCDESVAAAVTWTQDLLAKMEGVLLRGGMRYLHLWAFAIGAKVYVTEWVQA